MKIIYKIKENIFVGKNIYENGKQSDNEPDFVFKESREYLSPTKKNYSQTKCVYEYTDGWTTTEILEHIIYNVKKYVNGNLVSEWTTK